jgi:hypothetical protein
MSIRIDFDKTYFNARFCMCGYAFPIPKIFVESDKFHCGGCKKCEFSFLFYNDNS